MTNDIPHPADPGQDFYATFGKPLWLTEVSNSYVITSKQC